MRHKPGKCERRLGLGESKPGGNVSQLSQNSASSDIIAHPRSLVHFARGLCDAFDLPTLSELQAAGLPHREIVRRLWLNLAIRATWDAIDAEGSEVARW